MTNYISKYGTGSLPLLFGIFVVTGPNSDSDITVNDFRDEEKLIQYMHSSNLNESLVTTEVENYLNENYTVNYDEYDLETTFFEFINLYENEQIELEPEIISILNKTSKITRKYSSSKPRF